MQYGVGNFYGYSQYGTSNSSPALTGLFANDFAYIPKNVQVTRCDQNSLVISWALPDNPVSGYRIFGSKYWDGQWAPIGSTKNLTYIDSGLSPNQSYYYVVKSVY